jgi:CDP-diacylglycerol--serine O-phosphatidyltransferase
MKKHLPNAITLINLLCGCGALVAVFGAQPMAAVWWLTAAAVADFADGAVARALGVHSPLGQQLDSLADMVSFGVVPGAMLYFMLKENLPAGIPAEIALAGFVVSVFSGLRLGKFNLDTRQTENFIGLPTPASTILVTGLWLIYHFDSYGSGHFLGQSWVIISFVAIISALLVSEIPMFSLKIKAGGWQGNQIKYIFVAISILLLFLLHWAALAAIIVIYVLINLFFYWFKGKHHS